MRRCDIKGWIAVGLSAVMLSGCSGVSGTPKEGRPEKAEKVSLYDRGLELIARMDLMAETEEYTGMMTSSSDVSEVVREIGDGDYSTPKAVYEVKLSGDAMKNLMDTYGGQMSSLPEELQEDLKHRIASSVPTMLSALEGTNVLAAVSLIVADDYFIDDSVTEDTIYFYLYEGRCCGAVVFSVHDEGIVSASGRMVVSEILSQVEEEEQVKEWLVQNGGLLGAEISEVTAK